MRARKGFSLIEMIAVTALLGVAAIVTGPIIRTLMKDAPRVSRMIEADQAVSRMLASLRDDVEAAVDLPSKVGKLESCGWRVLIRTGQTVICYELSGENVVRRDVGPRGDVVDKRPTIWEAPIAGFKWTVGGADGGRYVETQTWIQEQRDGKYSRKLANAHVFFVAMAAGGRKDK